jgi:hypothetical protein
LHVNWIYILGTIGIISSIIGSARNRARQRRQQDIAIGVRMAIRDQHRRDGDDGPSMIGGRR